MKKRLAFLVVFSIFFMCAVACAEILYEGSCGEQMTWELDANGTLTISGTGNMDRYNTYSKDYPPWYQYEWSIKKVVVNPGVNSIGSYAFDYFPVLKEVEFADTVNYIEMGAFRSTPLETVVLPSDMIGLDDLVFADCQLLTTVTMPKTIQSLGGSVFDDCPKLTLYVYEESYSLQYAIDMEIPYRILKGDVITLDDLRYSFVNSRSNLGYSSDYKFPIKIYEMFFPPWKALVLYSQQGTWAGSCGGFARSAMMYNLSGSGLSLSAMNAGKVSQLSIGSFGSSYNLNAREIIEAFQVAQKTDYNNNHLVVNNLSRLVNAVREGILNRALPVIGVFGKRNGSNVGHALVGYKVEKKSDSETWIYVYDCNYPTDGTLHITLGTDAQGNYTSWYYCINHSIDCGTGYPNAWIQYITAADVKAMWAARNTTQLIDSWLTSISCKSYRIVDNHGNALAHTVNNALSRDSNMIRIYMGEDESPDADTLIYTDDANFTVLNLENDTMKVNTAGDYQGAFVTSNTSTVGFNIVDADKKNIVFMETDKGDSFTVTLYSDLTSERRKVTITGKGEGAEATVGLIGNDIHVDNCTDVTIAINDNSVDDLTALGQNINFYTVSLEFEETYYTGEEIKPAVIFSNMELNEGTDYKVTYNNNIGDANQDTVASVVIEGEGTYSGTKTLFFTILSTTLPDVATVGNINYSIKNGYATVTGVVKSKSSVKIPDSITLKGQQLKVRTVKAGAFQNDKKLTKLRIGNYVTTIEKNAFANCSKLKTVKGGVALKTIGKNAFSGDTKLKSVPDFVKLQIIEASAFKECKALTKITISSKVTSIGKQAFMNCSKLKTITISTKKLTTKSIGAKAFKGIHKAATVTCPSRKLSTYKKILVKKGVPKTAKFK